jgi:hypothetical protein
MLGLSLQSLASWHGSPLMEFLSVLVVRDLGCVHDTHACMCPLVIAGCVCLRRVRVEILSIRASVKWFLPDEIHRHPVTLTT